MRYIILIAAAVNLAAAISMIRDNADLRRRLTEQTDKHWECNRQIALYDDELQKLKARQKKSLWVISSDGYYPYCGACGARADKMTDYCPACGRRMRGKL